MIKTFEIQYQHEKLTLKAFVALPETAIQPAPAVLVAPDWQGRNAFACEKTKALAEEGYIGFALDMYGDARLGKDKTENRALMTPIRDNRPLLLERMEAALATLKTIDVVNPEKIAVIGYCFGGLCALDLARGGAEIRGAVSFHGLLNGPEIIPEPKIKAKVLVLHGHLDPLVSNEQISEFTKEMTGRNVDWQMHVYGQAAHSFTNPEANDNEMGLHYHPLSDQRSWQSCCRFLAEVFR